MSKVFNMVCGGGGPDASIFVTGLSETDTVTATNGAKTLTGKWKTVQKNVNVQVPTMTSNTSPSGECFAKSNAEEFDAQPYYAFVGSPVSDKAAHSTSGDAQGWWIGYDFGYDVKIEYFEICPQYRSNYTFWCRIAQTLTLQGSNDGSTWDDIQSFTRTDHLTDDKSSDTHEILKFTVDNPVTYRMFRVVWTTLTPTADAYSTCSYVQFVGTKIEVVSGHLIQPIRDFGTWTVTATDGTKTATQDVLVDVITEYEIEMDYKLWLYRDGDEFEDTTGGWERLTSGYTYSNASFAQNGSNNTFSKEEYNMHLTSYYIYSTLVATANSFDLSNYTKLHIESSGYGNLPICPIVSVSDSTSLTIEYPCALTTDNEYQYTEIDISDISIQSKIFLIAYSGARCHVRKVWLET